MASMLESWDWIEDKRSWNNEMSKNVESSRGQNRENWGSKKK